ncbi:hypothetical protein HDU98_009668 [Podochytrium sp. JEL0797]|nr:hypothetical protein HDU98_009668 [Podochytrium sp. JEL0797]
MSVPKGPGGRNLLCDDDDEQEQETVSWTPVSPIGLGLDCYQDTQTTVSPPPFIPTNSHVQPTHNHQEPIVLAHFNPAWRSQDFRGAAASQDYRFQPLHSPVMPQVVLPRFSMHTSHRLAPPPPAWLTPLPPPQTVMIESPKPSANQCSHTPMRACVRGFKRPKQMFKCTWEGCSKEFAKPSLLKSHENIHMSIKPFNCTACGVCFARNHDLRRHERSVHGISGAKEAQCGGCGKLFTRSDSCRFHEKTCSVLNGGLVLQRVV